MVSLLPIKFHVILFNSFRGVALTNCVTDRRTVQKQYVSPPNVIKFVSDLRQVGGFLLFPPPIKLTTMIL